MDGARGYYAKWNKSNREKKCHIKKKKTVKTDSQTREQTVARGTGVG